jgi:TPR repeat protein
VLLLLALCGLLFAGVALAGDDGQEMDPGSAASSAEEDFQRGMALLRAEGEERDAAAANEWLRKAADRGNPEAQYQLGFSYATGDGVPRDLARAVSWLERAAKRGNTEAQFNLGLLYWTGAQVSADPGTGRFESRISANRERARIWLRQAAESGHGVAGELLAAVERPENPVADQGAREGDAPAKQDEGATEEW